MATLARGLLWACAALGLLLAAAGAFSASSFGGPVVAGLLIRQVDAALAGHLALERATVLADGGIELRGLEVTDPEGHLVLQVTRARLFADLTRLRSRVIGLVLELDGPSVLLESEAGGSVSLARAFAPANPSPAPARPAAAPGRPSWTLRLTHLTLRGGEVWWQDEAGVTRLEASGVDADAEASYGPDGGFLELTARGDLAAPADGAAALAVAAHLDGDRLAVPVLAATLGGTRLEGLGEGDLGRGSFRAAVTRLGLTPDAVAGLARSTGADGPATRLGGDLAATLYGESDGALVTAALEVAPSGPPGSGAAGAGTTGRGATGSGATGSGATGSSATGRGAAGQGAAGQGATGPGRARAAVAVRPAAEATALGFDVQAEALDPARLVAQAPAGRVTGAARGAVAGPFTAGGLRARLDLALAPSRLRGTDLGPVALRGTAGRGAVAVETLDARLPGLAATARGRWREQGAVAGELKAEAADLARAGQALAALGVPGLPPLGGRARVEATLSGTAAAPALRASVAAPQVSAGDLRVDGAKLEVEGAGPLAALRGRVSGAVARLAAGAAELRAITLQAGLTGEEAALSASAQVPGFAREPLSVQASALRSKDRRTAELRELALAWPGARWTLLRPAQVTLAGPSVDRLELGDGPRRLALEGGLGPKEALDARVELRHLDLARLPRGLAPPAMGLAGQLDATAHATGTLAAPRVEATAAVEEGAARGLDGLTLSGRATWDGASHRLAGEAHLGRAAGGTLDVTADLPLPLAPAPSGRGARSTRGAPLALTASASGWTLAAVRQASGAELPVDGEVGGRVALTGTAGAPALAAGLTGAGLTWQDLGPFELTVTADDPGDAAHLVVEARHAGARLVTATARLPLDVAALLARPGPTARALLAAPLAAAVEIPGADLAPFAGRAGLPEGLAGTLTAAASLSGSAAAPRGTLSAALRDGAALGYREVGLTAEGALEGDRTALTARATLGREEALRLTAALALPAEDLADAAALRRAALTLDATVPPVSLERAAASVAAATGQVAAHLTARGTLAAPSATLDLDAAGVKLGGRPLGDLTATAKAGPAGATAELAFRSASGGALRAAGAVDAPGAPLGLDTTAEALARAPARARVTSEALDLGFLPALLPGLVRAAAGRLDVELASAAPLAELAPRGTVKLAGGRLAVTEYGDWTDLSLEARLTDHALEVPTLAARRGGGALTGHLALRDLGQARADLSGHLAFSRFTLARAGMDLATLDLTADLSGTVSPAGADATLTLPGGTVRLPRKSPRTLQSLEPRKDIVVGHPVARPGPPVLPGAGGKPFEVRVRVVMPGRLFVKAEVPRLDVELKGDTTWHAVAGEVVAEGSVETVRGTVEPIDGRLFTLERGKAQFTGAGYKTALLDVVARYDNPAAVVTATVSGTLEVPKVKLTAEPYLDDAAIAMLIATGRTELKVGTSEVGSLSGKDVGYSVAGAAAVSFLRDYVSEKLPFDSFSVASDSLRTGKYLTDKLFVGYTRRFEARPEKGENPDEVRVEYQLSPRWQLESRYGTAQSGGASLIWKRDY